MATQTVMFDTSGDVSVPRHATTGTHLAFRPQLASLDCLKVEKKALSISWLRLWSDGDPIGLSISTNRIYNTYWKAFICWCRWKNVLPMNPSLTSVSILATWHQEEIQGIDVKVSTLATVLFSTHQGNEHLSMPIHYSFSSRCSLNESSTGSNIPCMEAPHSILCSYYTTYRNFLKVTEDKDPFPHGHHFEIVCFLWGRSFVSFTRTRWFLDETLPSFQELIWHSTGLRNYIFCFSVQTQDSRRRFGYPTLH